MNFYDIEEDIAQYQYSQQEVPSEEYDNNEEPYEQPEKLDTFEGYVHEEPIMYFNYVEEAPKKKIRPITKKVKKQKKSDSETDAAASRKRVSKDMAKLQQCQMLKTIISQMEQILQSTRTQIINEFLKKQNK